MIRHLFVPGLLGPVPGFEVPRSAAFPHLERLLARADRAVEPAGYPDGLFALFDIRMPAGADLPSAALSFLADMGEAPPGCVLHADPLQLLPDRDSVLAFDLDDDPLDRVEIASLEEAFNAHFKDDGVRLRSSPGGHIYLLCAGAPSIRTAPLASVIGRDLDRFLPEGGDRRWWHGLLNETQMLCHALDLNREREARGRSTLGGLWLSGGGSLPPGGAGPVARMTGDCRVARGLLALRPGSGTDELVVEHAPGRALTRVDSEAWLRAVGTLDKRLVDLQQDCDELHVHPGNGTVYRWHARSARRWWRRTPPLATHLDAGGMAPRGLGQGKQV